MPGENSGWAPALRWIFSHHWSAVARFRAATAGPGLSEVSAESAPWWRQLRCCTGRTVFFCRQIAASSVENAEDPGFGQNPEKSRFHTSGLSNRGFCINRPPLRQPFRFREEPGVAEGHCGDLRILLRQASRRCRKETTKEEPNKSAVCSLRRKSAGLYRDSAGTLPTAGKLAVCVNSDDSRHCLDCDDVVGRLCR